MTKYLIAVQKSRGLHSSQEAQCTVCIVSYIVGLVLLCRETICLLFQGMLYYFPIVFWRSLNSRTGIDVNDIVETAEKVSEKDMKDMKTRVRTLHLLKNQMHRYLSINKTKTKYRLCSEGCKFNCSHISHHICGKHKGNYITLLYMVIKCIFLANAFGQLWLTNVFLGPWEYQYYGFHVIMAIYNGEDWTQSPRFPRVTMCDLDIRRLGNNHKYTVQCVLAINLFNEMIYLFLWFWMVMVAIATAIGFFMWICRLFLCSDETTYVHKYLNEYKTPSFSLDKREPLYDDNNPVDRRMMKRFIDEYLRMDGLLIVRLIDYNTDKMTMQDFLSALYEHWLSLPYVHREEEKELLLA